MITAITATGDRTLTFALCRRWMEKQIVKAEQWIVVDDGKVQMPKALRPEGYIRRTPQPTDPKNHTLYANLRVAIEAIEGDKIIFIEDDEYYAPTYIGEISRRLDADELVGINISRYYNLITGGYRLFKEQAHASLAQTAFRASFLPIFVDFLGKENCAEFLDVRLWTQRHSMLQKTIHLIRRNIRGQLFYDDLPIYVGMKSMPGRAGVGVGHKPTIYREHDTSDRQMLRKWIPGDCQAYLDILNGSLTEQNYESYFST